MSAIPEGNEISDNEETHREEEEEEEQVAEENENATDDSKKMNDKSKLSFIEDLELRKQSRAIQKMTPQEQEEFFKDLETLMEHKTKDDSEVL